MNTYTVYTDGASRGNPGPGGWGVIIVGATKVEELAGRETHVTNNQMELRATLEALHYLKKHDPQGTVLLHADSAYVLNGLGSWLDGWVHNNWITSTKKPVENKELWQALLELRNHFGTRLELIKVAGHSGHLYNDRCDELAVFSALSKNPKLFSGTVKEYESYLAANPPVSEKKPTKSKSQSGTAYSYVSVVDGKVHADKTWAACEKRVKGKKGAQYKKVFSKAEETALIQDYTLQTLL